MRPELYVLHAFGRAFDLRSYGVAMAVAFVVAIWIAVRAAQRTGEEVDPIRDLCLWLLVSSVLAARLLFVLTNLPAFAAVCAAGVRSRSALSALWACTRPLHLWEGGLVFYGGLLGAALFAVWYTRRHGLSFPRVADLLAPAVALGHFFGRLGCFAAGCCWGRETGRAWGAHFPPASLAFEQYLLDGKLAASALSTPALHPVQLYEAAVELALFAGLSWLLPRKRYDGQILVGYLAAYSIARFALELWRGDAGRGFVAHGPSTSQAIALATLGVALALARRFRGAQRGFSRA